MTMTAKERRQYRRMEIMVEEMQESLRRSEDSRRNVFIDYVDLKISAREALEAIVEAAEIMRDALSKPPECR